MQILKITCELECIYCYARFIMIKISKGESKSKCKSGEERGREKKYGEFVDVNAAELVKEES